MKKQLLIGLISTFGFLLSQSAKAQVPVADFTISQTTVCAGTQVQVTDNSSDSPTAWSYTLTGGAPATSTVQNPTVVYNTSGTYTITLIATNGNGPSTEISKTITVNALPTLAVSGATAFCAGGSVTQTVSGADTYTWSTGVNTTTETFSPMADTDYTVTGTNTLTGCESSMVISIVVNPLPVLSVSGATAACLGSSVTQTVTGADTYTWSEASFVGSVITLTPTVPTTYTVTGTSLAGCTGSTTVSLAVNPTPTITISGATSTVCAGASITQTATGADTYLWSDGDATDVATLTPVASGMYTVTGTAAASGCTAMATVSITVIAAPALTLTGTSAYCAGGSASQTVTGADSYLWSTGATIDNETFNPAVSTDYTVTGTSTLTGCSSEAVVSITVNPIPVLTVSGATAACLGSSVTQTVTGADTYTWSESNFVGSVITLTPNVPTTYTVTGTTLAGCTGSTTVSLAVNPIPTISISGATSTVCAGASITQTATGADTYLWSDGDATDVATLTPAASGMYTVTGTSLATGCSAPATVSITVIAAPSLTLTGPSAYCIGGSASQTVTGADSYLWSTGATIDNETFNPVVSTDYTVTGTSTLTGCSSEAVASITVYALPVLSVSGNTAACMGSGVSQTVTGASTYTWSEGSFVGSVISLTPTVPTDYTVTGTDANGCVNSTTITLGVNALPVVAIAGGNTVCAGSAITQTASGADTYVWDNANTGDVATYNPTTSGNVTVTGTSTLTGCSAQATASITAIALPSLTLTGNAAFCDGGSTTQTVTGADTYSWSTGNITDNESFNPAITTTYSVSGTNTLTGCWIEIPVLITVNPNPTITVSDGTVCAGQIFTMSPNGADTYTYSNGTNTVIPTGNASYTITGTSTAGCAATNTAIASVTVNALPTITANSGAICAGSSFTIIPGGGVTYTVTAGNTATVTPATSTDYTVTGTDANGCVSSVGAIASVTVNALPSLTVTGNATICVGQTTTLTATGATSYTWDNTPPASNSLTASPATNTTYSVEGTDANGCKNTMTQLVTVNALPIVSVNNGTICQGSSFVMIPGGATSYTFSSGTATVSPMSNTNYSVIGSNANGCVSQSVVSTVSVAPAITVTITGPTSVCQGVPTSYTAAGATSYTWGFGGPAGYNSVTTLTPTATDMLYLIGTAGPCSSNASVTVNVNALPVIQASSSNPVICAGETAVITATGAVTYTWIAPSANTATISVSPGTTTTYTVAGTNNSGCSNAATVTQTVDACTSIDKQNASAISFNVYPNPNSGEFTVELQQNASLLIMNSMGQLIRSEELQAGNHAVNLTEQANGIYFITVKQGTQSKTTKVIKN